ncbi:MAG: hypothetical protein R3330_06095, partial [Saprospiraceae bacterium]|nr:hypothetical protein [Saprospiraceae bacterium]
MPSKYRYPGPISFSKEQQHLFFGRREEAKAVCELLISSRILTMHGESGSGKSSLIQAGIIPEIRGLSEKMQREVHLIDINFQSLANPVAQFKATLEHDTSPPDFDQIMTSGPSMWYDLKRFLFTRRDVIPLLILDQFEQLFSREQAEVDSFVRQLAEINYGYMPRPFADDLAISRMINPSLEQQLDHGLEEYLATPLE